MNSELEKLSIQANESDFNYDSDEIYEEQNESLKTFLNVLGMILLGFTIIDSKLSLKSTEKVKVKRQLGSIIIKAFNDQVKLEKNIIYDILHNSIKTNYYKKVYLLSLGTDIDIKKINNKVIDSIIKDVVEGKSWMDRNSINKKKIRNILISDIDKFSKGSIDVNDIKNIIEKRFKTNAYMTNRLIDNEIARCQFQINDYFAKEYGIEKQVFSAVLDMKTTEKCRGLHGKIFKVSDPKKPRIPQDTHVNCRSSYINIPSREWNYKNNGSVWGNYSKWYKENIGD